MKKILLIITVLISTVQLYSQEIISGIQSNALLEQLEMPKFKTSQTKVITPIQIPFVDDFSKLTFHPDTSHWIDNYVFINNDYCYNPLTIGVATFDALDGFGKIHNNAQSTSFDADTLTSKPIRLDTVFYTIPKRAITIADSIYFSFLFQPGGGMGAQWALRGLKPETGDSLILEFGYKTGNFVYAYSEYQPQTIVVDTLFIGDSVQNHCYPDQWIIANQIYYENDIIDVPCDSIFVPEVIWAKAWASKGMSLQEMYNATGKYFQQVMIPITNAQYINAGFQFRFRNIASLDNTNLSGWKGNDDQWNIDYVKLDIGRTQIDTNYKDVAFASNAPSSLKNYQSMPWKQFIGFQSAELAINFNLNIANLYNTTKNSSYTYNVLNSAGGANIYTYTTNNENITPYYPNGYHNYQPHSQPLISYTYPEDTKDSALFVINHIFKGDVSDERLQNDTIRNYQKFYNYFAYDDGTAENGYGLNVVGSKLAYKFKLNREDTLQAVQMFFNRTADNQNVQYFVLTVWNDNGGVPGSVIYEQNSMRPMFSDSLNKYVYYMLNNPLKISGTFYVGWRQSTADNLNIGFDRNTNTSQNIFYNTNGNWENSLYSGSLMIRPVVGKQFTLPTIINEIEILDITIYPNPNNGNIFYANILENSQLQYTIFDITGRVIDTQKLNIENNIEQLKNGIYIIEISDGKHYRNLQKLVVNK